MAEHLYDRLEDRFGKAGALNERGVTLQLMGDLEGAKSCQEESFRLYRDLGDRLGQADALNQLGIVEQARGNNDIGAGQIRQALQTFRDLGNQHSEAEALNNLGNVHLSIPIMRGRSLELFELALGIARAIGARHEEARALEGAGNYYAVTGGIARAIQELQLAREVYHSISSPRTQKAAELIEHLKRQLEH